MPLVLLRLAIAPAVVIVATVAQRRFGHVLGGRLVGFPLTTGPFLLVLCLTHGAFEAAKAATGIVAGQASVVMFCITYGWVAPRARWPRALAAAVAAGLGSAGVLAASRPQPWLAAAAVLAMIATGLVTWPGDGAATTARGATGVGQTAVRVVVTGALVGALAAAVHVLGPYLAGVLATCPLILSVMTPSTHATSGAQAAAALVRGTLVSMVGTVTFVTALAYGLAPLGISAFALAGAALLGGDSALRTLAPKLATSG